MRTTWLQNKIVTVKKHISKELQRCHLFFAYKSERLCLDEKSLFFLIKMGGSGKKIAMQTTHSHTPAPVKVVSLFSGGLDSILAAKAMQRQGIEVLALHFVTPFFGRVESIPFWQREYGLTIQPVDVSEEFLRLLLNRPPRGFGKVLNPCVDCKVLMMRHAKKIMESMGAVAIVSGEVLGQRPMSQRTETLHTILNDADVRGLVLRPLSAKLLQPTQAELDGHINREALYAISGRGRKAQLALAEEFGLKTIPTPAGGCKLTETEIARNYWKILNHLPAPQVSDFFLADCGRQFWSPECEWLIIGRNKRNNELLLQHASSDDYLFRVERYAGPISLGRNISPENTAVFTDIAELVATYSPKAMQAHEAGETIGVRVHRGSLDDTGFVIEVTPRRDNTCFTEASWEEAKEEKRAEARAKFERLEAENAEKHK